MLPFLALFINPLIGAFRKYGYQYLHAAACRIFGRNILFSGLSGRGKSTASLALAMKGHFVMTDESVLLRNRNDRFEAVALMNWIKVSQQTLYRFWPSFNGGSQIFQGEIAIRASELNMASSEAFTSIDCICALRQSGCETTDIQSADTLDVVPEILPVSVYSADKESMEKSFIFLTDFLKEVPCYKVSFGTDMNRFVQEIELLACSLGTNE